MDNTTTTPVADLPEWLIQATAPIAPYIEPTRAEVARAERKRQLELYDSEFYTVMNLIATGEAFGMVIQHRGKIKSSAAFMTWILKETSILFIKKRDRSGLLKQYNFPYQLTGDVTESVTSAPYQSMKEQP